MARGKTGSGERSSSCDDRQNTSTQDLLPKQGRLQVKVQGHQLVAVEVAAMEDSSVRINSNLE